MCVFNISAHSKYNENSVAKTLYLVILVILCDYLTLLRRVKVTTKNILKYFLGKHKTKFSECLH